MDLNNVIFIAVVILMIALLIYIKLKIAKRTASKNNHQSDSFNPSATPSQSHKTQRTVLHDSNAYLKALGHQEDPLTVDARHINHFELDLGEKGFQQLSQILNISEKNSIKMINKLQMIVIDIGCDWMGQHRFIPITFKLSHSLFLIQDCFIFKAFTINNAVFRFDVEHSLCGAIDHESLSIEQAYPLYLDYMQGLFAQGWKKYFYVYEVRYAASENIKCLEKDSHCIAPEQLMSLDEFKTVMTAAQHDFMFKVFLENIVLEVLFTEDYAVSANIYDMNYLNNDCSHDRRYDRRIKTFADPNNLLAFDKFKTTSAIIRAEKEQIARAQGYRIDEDYIDPF